MIQNPTKEHIKIGLSDAIMNCNRNIHNWIQLRGTSSKFTISYTEIKGLVKNWIVRRLRTMMNVADIDRALKHGNLNIFVSEKYNYISGMELSSSDTGWASRDNAVRMLNIAMKEIDYESLRYTPTKEDKKLGEFVSSIYDHPLLIDFSSIENIKF